MKALVGYDQRGQTAVKEGNHEVKRGFYAKLGALAVLACGVAPTALLAQDSAAAQATQIAVPGAIVRPASDGDALIDVATDGKSAIQIDVIALDGSDPVLKLLSARNRETVLAENDDGGGSLNARLTFDPATMPAALGADGHILLRVEDYRLEGVGKYAIITSTLDKLTPEKTLGYGSTETVAFLEGNRPRLYAFEAKGGDLVEIRLNAVGAAQQSDDDDSGSSVDPVLKVYNSPFPAIDPIQSNDDSPEGGLDSLLRFVVPATGTYFIAAENFNSDGGQATLSLKKAQPLPPPPAPTRLTTAQLGRGLCGEIGEDAPALDWFNGDQHYALYSVTGRREDVLTLRSSGDVAVQYGYMTPAGFAQVADGTDEDGESSDTRQLRWNKDGELHILVSGSTGSHFGLGTGTADQLQRCQ